MGEQLSESVRCGMECGLQDETGSLGRGLLSLPNHQRKPEHKDLEGDRPVQRELEIGAAGECTCGCDAPDLLVSREKTEAAAKERQLLQSVGAPPENELKLASEC